MEKTNKPKIQMVPIARIATHTENPKRHDIEQIKASIRRFGFVAPLIRDESSKRLVAGHGRLQALREMLAAGEDRPLGLGPKWQVPVLTGVAFANREEALAYLVADNRLSEMGGWDKDALSTILQELAQTEAALAGVGYTLKEVEKMAAREARRLLEDPGPQELPQEPKTQPGDVWLLGEHRVICGDCTEALVVEKLMDGRAANMLLTDPPYNVAYVGKTAKKLTIENDEMSDASFRSFLVDSFRFAFGALQEGGAFYIWHADSEGFNFRGAVRDVGEQVRQCIIWAKNCLVMGRQDYQWKHEPCLYGWKKGASHHWYAGRDQTTILEFDKPSRSEDHPTMKPVPLFERLIQNSSKEGDVILDVFLGSGTSLIAAERTGRICYGVEKDPRYCDVIVRRWQEMTGKTATLLAPRQEPS